MTPGDLDLVPVTELIDAVLRRRGVACVVGIYDMKAHADGAKETPIYGVLSSGDHPLRMALGLMIDEHLSQLNADKMQIHPPAEAE